MTVQIVFWTLFFSPFITYQVDPSCPMTTKQKVTNPLLSVPPLLSPIGIIPFPPDVNFEWSLNKFEKKVFIIFISDWYILDNLLIDFKCVIIFHTSILSNLSTQSIFGKFPLDVFSQSRNEIKSLCASKQQILLGNERPLWTSKIKGYAPYFASFVLQLKCFYCCLYFLICTQCRMPSLLAPKAP